MDMFSNEQRILEDAGRRIKEIQNGAAFDFNEYIKLTDMYGRLLKHARITSRLADNLLESNMDLTDKVHLDTLTRVYSRRFLEDAVGRYIKSLSRSNGCISMLFIDIDNFKDYNDTYGHDQGDICLKTVASAFTASITREDDFVARFGGEEFCIVLPHTNERGAEITAQRVLECVRGKNIIHEKNTAAPYVTVSIGGTTAKVKHTHSVVDYVKRADEAMYSSKQNGKDRYTFLEFKYELEL